MTFLDAPPRQTERAFERQVIQFAELMGWRVWKDRATNQRSRCRECGAPLRCVVCKAAVAVVRNAAGWLDLVLIRRPRIVFAELKADRGTLSDEQRACIALLRACDQEVYVWRPSSWDLVEKLLR